MRSHVASLPFIAIHAIKEYFGVAYLNQISLYQWQTWYLSLITFQVSHVENFFLYKIYSFWYKFSTCIWVNTPPRKVCKICKVRWDLTMPSTKKNIIWNKRSKTKSFQMSPPTTIVISYRHFGIHKKKNKRIIVDFAERLEKLLPWHVRLIMPMLRHVRIMNCWVVWVP